MLALGNFGKTESEKVLLKKVSDMEDLIGTLFTLRMPLKCGRKKRHLTIDQMHYS